ncbi:MAG TPA: oligosaccharide flippase family protein [Ignavibacteriaceae bacterium]|nr:oligosaccharide flippase family protein [Ignavibacteriaceae bacterium]
MKEKKAGLSESTFWYTLGNLLIRSISFLLLPLYSNLISTEDFGRYSLLMAFYTIAAVFYQGGLTSALTKFYLDSEDENYRHKIFSATLNLILLIGVSLTILASAFAADISNMILSSEKFSGLILLTLVTLFIESLVTTILQLLKTKELSRRAVSFAAISAVTNLLLNILLVYYLGWGIRGIITAQLLSALFVFLILIPTIRKEYIFSFETPIVKSILSFSYPLIAAGILSTAVDVIDRFIINHYFGEQTTGIYSFSYKIALVMNVFVISMRTAWTPHSIRLFRSGIYSDIYGKVLTKIIAVSSIIFLSTSLLAGDLFNYTFNGKYLFNPSYQGGVIIIPLVLIAYGFNALAGFYATYPYIKGKSSYFFYVDLLALVFNLLFNYLLIPKFGIVGAAIATLISYCAGFMFYFIISYKKLQINYQLNKILQTLIVTSIAYFICSLVNKIYFDLIIVVMVVYIFKRITSLDFRFGK